MVKKITISFFQGSPGKRGKRGCQGYQGAQGASGGIMGEQGETGYQGFTGFQGAQGNIAGYQGTAGYQGAAAGPQGASGYQGATGYQGLAGSYPANVLESFVSTATPNVTGDGTTVTFSGQNFALTNNTIGTGWNPTTGIYTVPTTGYYLVVATMTFYSLTAGWTAGFLETYGSVVRIFYINPGDYNALGKLSVSWSHIYSLTAGYQIYLLLNISGNTKTIGVENSSSAGDSCFCIYQLA